MDNNTKGNIKYAPIKVRYLTNEYASNNLCSTPTTIIQFATRALLSPLLTFDLSLSGSGLSKLMLMLMFDYAGCAVNGPA